MTADPDASIAEELTLRIAAVDGVNAVLAHGRPAPLLLRRVLPAPIGASALVDVEIDGTSIVVSARLATSRATPAVAVLEGVRTAVVALIGDRPCALHVEIAAID